eukprot:scaffold26622_cov147-Skeletonema_menzelii.AAC.19
MMSMLPIAAHRSQILYALENFGVVIIVGETGCGKSTMLPRYFYENGWADGDDREIICTQPRRIAAITLATRVSQEMQDRSGIVGYSVRFSSTYNPGTTKIRYVTDGWLLRETLLLDPLLKRCSVLIIDEAHDRSLNTDLLLGVVKKIRRVRPDLRLVVCSATLDAEAFLEFFIGKKQKDKESKQRSGIEKRRKNRKSRWGRIDDDSDATKGRNGTIISVDGRQHPVDIIYSKEPVSDYIQSTIETALQIHESEMQAQPFLPRSDDELKNKTRRIIFATNIAETSVTVPRIAHVIDCGFAKMPFFDPYSGFDRLIVCPISRASAQQRAGRAGRVRSGKCYRLYSEKDFLTMEVDTAPEIQRCQLSTLIMTIKALGVHNILSFDLLSMPSAEALSHGLESLSALGAIDDKAELTELGKEMIYFPTDARVSRMLLASLDMESRKEDTSSSVSKLIVGDILTVAAALQVRNLFIQPRSERQWRNYDDAMADILDRSGDHLTMVHLVDLCDHAKNILSEDECRERFVNRVALKRVLDVRNQLARFLNHRFGGGSNWFGSKRQELVGSNALDTQERSEAIRKCVCAGYFMNAAKLGNDGCYYTLRGRYAVSISSASVLHRYGESSDFVLFGETFDGSSGGVDVMPVCSISGLWLQQLAPHYWAR